ncbi:P-loop containing nucleoside triphosphate hydrolase protein [Ilyonectria sp. MPI-CAGE-AT-0026]|nr:P-loop containing nucleoside triphosphate hydrolase protein [Ilyonectria sp. MPI-CAGE-AT-0026]
MEDYDFSSEGIILVLGVTGAGKSYFLNQLKSHSATEGHSLHSETLQCNAVQIFLDDEEKRSITVVDTPGFDDTTRPQGEVLAEIAEFLAAQHALGVPLRGVLYLHKITENRMTGSSMTYLRLLESLVGGHALENVILVTTMWNQLRDEDRGKALRREQELLDRYWAPMEEKGSYVAQFDGTSDSAYALVFQLAGKDSVVLDVQREIIDEDRTVLATSVGSDLLRRLQDDGEAYRLEAAELESRLQRAMEAEPKDKDLIRHLREEKSDVEKILHHMDESVSRMRVRPGSSIRDRIRQAMTSSNRAAIGGAAAILAAVVNLTVFVVQLGLGG